MTTSLEEALIEAGNPATSPERLQQLSERKRRHERTRLRQVIAANPNADVDLLCALAADFPMEVLGNPRFQLLQFSSTTWCDDWDMRSLCSLTLAAGKHAPPHLKSALKTRCEEIHDYFSEYVSIVRRETWCYARSIEIPPGDGAGLVPFGIGLKIELDLLMEGRNDSACLEINESAASLSSSWVSLLLQSLRNEDIESLFEVFCPWSESVDITMEDEADKTIRISTTNRKIRIQGDSVLLRATGETLFDLHVFYLNNEEALPVFSDGVLQIPIFEHIGGDSEGLSRGSNDDLGILEPLWGWEPAFLAPEIPKDSWEKWLSMWIMD